MRGRRTKLSAERVVATATDGAAASQCEMVFEYDRVVFIGHGFPVRWRNGTTIAA